LKLSKYLLAPLLSNVINECTYDGAFSYNLATADVVHIFKLGDSKIITTYRPILVPTYIPVKNIKKNTIGKTEQLFYKKTIFEPVTVQFLL